VPITDVLLNHIQDDGKPLNTLDSSAIKAYLTSHLKWRVLRVRLSLRIPSSFELTVAHLLMSDQKNVMVPLDTLQSLRVSLSAGKANHSDDDEVLSTYSDYEVVYEVTQRRQGGLSKW